MNILHPETLSKVSESFTYTKLKDIVSIRPITTKNSKGNHVIVIYTKVKDLNYYVAVPYATDINEVSKKIYDAM
jgi:hypothetical protein